MKTLLAQINANPRMRNCGLSVIVCGIILAFPQTISWLPKEAFDMAWRGADEGVKIFIGMAILFAKQSNNTGLPSVPEKKSPRRP